MRGVRCNVDRVEMLALKRAGRTYQDIALLTGVSVGTAWNEIAKARDDERAADAARRGRAEAVKRFRLELTPMYPANFSSTAPCPHRGEIRRGSLMYCEQCGKSGMDHHPALQRSAASDPTPDRKPPSAPLTKPRQKAKRSKANV